MARGVAQMQRWIIQGRGAGHGIDYRPWLNVQEVMSVGRSHKIPGIKVARTHHVFSDLEAACLLVLEFQADIVDIREQFPLLPTELTQRAAASLSICHPTYPGTSVPQVLTSDFCVDVRSCDSAVTEAAIAVKYGQALSERRVRELLAIERAANHLVGRSWILFTETTIPSTVIRNLNWLRHHTLPRGTTPADLIRDFCQAIHRLNQSGRTLGSLLAAVAARLHISHAEALRLFRFVGWHQDLIIQLEVGISLGRPLALTERAPRPLQLSGAPISH